MFSVARPADPRAALGCAAGVRRGRLRGHGAAARPGDRGVDEDVSAGDRRRSPIDNTNGKVDIEGVDGSSVEVHIEKIARRHPTRPRALAASHFIKERLPSRVSLNTERMNGVMIGAGFGSK